MTSKHALIAALAATLAAPVAAAAQTIPDAAAISRGVTRDVTREVRRAVRTFSDRYDQEKQGPQQTEKITKSFKVGKTGSLDLNNFNGDVTVTGYAGDEITVEAVKRVRARTPEEGKAALAALQVDITERAGRVEVHTDFAKRDVRGGVDYTITVPAPTAVSVRTMSGDVKVTGVKGDLRADSLSGDVTLAGTGASVRAKTLSGDVTVSDITGDGELSFSSISGDVTAQRVKAKSIEISNTSGELKMVDVTCTRATAATMSGNVEFTGPLVKGGRYELRSHSGDVRLTPTSTTGFEVDASTFSGTFRSDFPVTLRASGPTTVSAPVPPPPPPPPPAPPAGGQTGERTATPRPPRPPRPPGAPSRMVQGTYGDGSAALSLVSFSGDITIVKK